MSKTLAALTAHEAKASGYCITSRKSPTLASRIDRPDWLEHMGWKTSGSMAADQYRRVYSTDTITVPSSWIKILPNSHSGVTKFIKRVK